MFALRSQLSLSFVWFDSGAQRLAIVPDRWATFSPGLAAFSGGSSQAVDRLKTFPVAGLTMPAWPRLAAEDAFAFRLAGGAFAPPLSLLSAKPFPVAATLKSGVPAELVFMSPEIVALVPQAELAGARVFILDPGKDVIGQVSSALQANPGASVVRVLSHGEPGSLMLAGQRITRDTLQLRADEIAGWRRHLAPGADILLYGCSVAGTTEGRRFVDVMAALTLADVAASVNRTGAAPLGGDLVLEYATGPIEARTGRFAQAWDQSGLILAAPVFSSAPTATFTTGVSGSFTAAATGSPTYSIAQKTFFESNFTALPTGWTLANSAQISGGACVLNPATSSTAGALILPKLGASSPGSFTALFDYTTANVTATGNTAIGTSFNYGVLSATTGSGTGMVGSNGLVVSFLEAYIKAGAVPITVPASVEVRWNGTVIASAPITFGSGAKPLQIKLDAANLLTVSYDSAQVLHVNLSGKVNTASRTQWQFALGASNTASNASSHTIANLAITSNGVLPAGLALDANTGVISGTPTTAAVAGTQVFNLVTTNADGTASQPFSLNIASGAPVFTSADTNSMLPGVAITVSVAAPGSAGATTYSVDPQTLVTTTLANAGTLPAGASVNGSARFNAGALELTQNVASQTGTVQFLGQGAQNPTAFSASFNYKVGGGTTVGGTGISFNYGAPGDTTKGLRVNLTELVGTSNANLQVAVSLNNLVASSTNIANPFTAALYGSPSPYLPVRLAVSAEGRVQVWVNDVLVSDSTNVTPWQTADKSLWAFSLTGTTGASNNNVHTVKNLVIGTNGILPPGLSFDTTTGVISGKVGSGTAVDSYVNVTASNAAGTVMQLLKLDVTASNTLPGQRPGTGTSLGGPNSLGVTGEQFRNLSAFAALTANGSVSVWGNTANGGKQADAPTGTGYTTITSNEKAFAALRNDGTIFAWGFSGNGGTGEPTGTGYQMISATRDAFAAIKNDGSIVAWGNTANGGSFSATSTAAPTGTGYIRIFANGGGFAAQKIDGTIRTWGHSNSIGTTPPALLATTAFGPRVTVNDYQSGTASYGAFAAISTSGTISTWGSSLAGGTTGKPNAAGQQEIVTTARAMAAIDSNGFITAWGDTGFGGTNAPKDSGFRQLYGNSAAFVAIRQDGSLSAWGSTLSGGSGAPTGTGYVQVFSTLNSFAAMKADGSISVWGSALEGGNTKSAPAGTGYTNLFSSQGAFAASKADGSVTVWGDTSMGGTGGPAGAGWVEITSSGTAFVARKSDGTLYSWGSSLSGGTGAPTGNFLTVQSPTRSAPYLPISAGAPVNLALNQTVQGQVLPGIQGDGLTFSLTSGKLPIGLQLDAATGWIYGNPAEPGSFPLTLNATGATGSVTQAYTLRVNSSLLPNQRQGAGAVYTIGSGTEFPNSTAFAGLTANGGVYAWGANANGGTGAPTGTGYTKITANSSAYAALKYDGSISAWGDSRYGGVGAPTGSGYTQIYSASNAFAALKADGSISAWGLQNFGGSYAPTGTGYTKIYATASGFAALKADGSITGWYAVMGPTGSGYTSITPNAGAYAALKADGSITAWGDSVNGGSNAPTGTGYTKIFASNGSYAALKVDGSIAVWGNSNNGGGTNGPTGIGFVDVWSSANGFAAMKTDGSLVSWGASGTFDTSFPTDTGFTQVFSTGGSFAAMRANGSIVSWGATDSGGTGAPGGTGYTTIYTNNNAFAALKADGSITAWGKSTTGGFFSPTSTASPTGTGYTQIFSRANAFAAMKADGTVKVWGSLSAGVQGASAQVAFASLQNATAVAPAREFGVTGNLPAPRPGTSLATQALGLNGVAAYQVGANTGLGLGSAITSGSLPGGLSLNVATGFLEGTATKVGTSNFTVSTYNGTGQSSQDYSLSVLAGSTSAAAPAFASTKAIGYANYAVGQAATYDLTATSSVPGTVNYSLIAGALPPGMILTISGSVTGTPTTPGNYSFTLAASDTQGIAVRTFTIKVSADTPNQRPGQYSTIDTQSNGTQGLNESAFAALKPDGTIVTWGDSTYGGFGATGVPTGLGYVQIAQTSRAFAALRYDGTIKSWGNSDYGGLGAPTGFGFTRLFSNGYAFAAMKADGSITTWGADLAGGTGEPTGTGYTQIFTNSQAMVAMKTDGSLVAWGATGTGGTGAPTGTGYVTLTSNASAFAALKSDGSITAWGDTTFGGLLPTLASNNSYTAIYANPNAFAALRADGTITTWGATFTGDNPFTGGSNFISVSATGSAFAALKSDGTLTAWGNSGKGGSNGPTGTGFTAIFSNQSAFAGLRLDGSIVSWGNTGTGATGAPVGTGWTQIYSNAQAFTALKNDGTVKSWGNANYGGVGKAPTTTGFTQVFSTMSAFVGQKSDGSLVAWGASASGISGTPTGTGLTVSSARAAIPYQEFSTTGELPTAYVGTKIGSQGGAGPAAYQVGAISQGSYSAVTAGTLPSGMILNQATGFLSGTPTTAGTYTFTITTTSAAGATSQVYTLEVKDPLSVLLPSQRVGSSQVVSNLGAFAALNPNGSIAAWGDAGAGGTGAPAGTGFTQVFATEQAFAALKADGSLVSWGSTRMGGTGAPAGTGFTKVFSNAGAFVALKADGSIVAWGDNSIGGTGAPAGTGFTQVFANGGAFAALQADGAMTSWGDNSRGGSGAPTGTGFTGVFSNANAFAALKDDGAISTWGLATGGGTGAPTSTGFTQVFSTLNAFAALKSDGSITAWGDSSYGGTGTPTGTGFTALFSTDRAFSALKANGSIIAWGNTAYGGIGTPTGTGYTQVFSNRYSFAALKADGSITAWGGSDAGGTGAPTATGFTQVFSNSLAYAALKADGSLTAWGSPDRGGTGAPAGTGFTQVFSNANAFAALKADGSITAWGGSNYGGTGAPTATGFATVQSAAASLPAFGTYPAAAALTSTPNQPFFAHLGAQGVGLRYEIAVGSLPAGLTLDATTGAVSGSATQSGSYFFTLAASNPLGVARQAFSLVVPASTSIAITWPTAVAITYGQALSASALSGGSASVPGTFAFTNPGTVPNAGTAAQSVTFTPTNPSSGSAETRTVSVTVNKALLTVTADSKSRASGAANPAFTATITGFVNGETSSVVSGAAAFSTTATSGSAAGNYPITPTAGTLAANNYAFAFADGSLSVGLTAPTLADVTIASNNPAPTRAKVGNTVTVTFTASEAIATPTATIAGRAATVALVSGRTYTASLVMAAGDDEGSVPFSLSFTALTGAPGVAVTATTNSSAVTFDETAPTLTAVTIASNNLAPTEAKPGDTVTVTFTADEVIGTPTATIAGRAATIANTSGNTYTATGTMAAGDAAGAVAFSLGFTDLAGNAGTPVTTTTNASSVTFEEPGPTVTATGVVTTLAGSATNGAGAADGTGTAASFSAPYGVAVDVDGTVYVADYTNHRIRKITSAGVVTTLAGSGTAGSAEGTGVAASFNTPSGVAVQTDGTVYVADYANHKIRKITPAGVVTTLAGSGAAGNAEGTGAAASFRSPSGVAVAADGTVYVSDYANNKIRTITPAGVVTTLAGSGTAGAVNGTGAAASFNQPSGVAVGADGAVYVADYANHKIRKIVAGVVTTLAGSGTAGVADGTGTAASFNGPTGIAVGADGTLHVADNANNRIRRITPAGVVTTLAGSPTNLTGSADGTGLSASFNAPYGVAMGTDGTVYVADRSNNKIRKITVGSLTNTVLALSSTTVTSGASLTLSATVTLQSATGGAATPTGTVTFKVGQTTIGTATLNGAGIATLTVNTGTLAGGVSGLSAIYQGRAGGAQPDLVASTSTVVSLTVNVAPTLLGAAAISTFTAGAAGALPFVTTGYPTPSVTTASTLPAGVTLSSGGLLAGTPAAGSGGTYPVTISVSNGIGAPISHSFTLVVNSAPVFGGSAAFNTVASSPIAGQWTAVGYPLETNPSLFAQDFSAGALPTGWTVSGAAALNGGVLELTPAVNNSRGILTLPAVGATSPTGFSARFNLIVGNTGGADGLSFNYGALLTGTALAAVTDLENGLVSAGLVITFGEYSDDRVEVRYNNQILSAVYVPLPGAAAVDVTVTPLGLLTLTADGTTLTTVNLGADYVAAAKAGWQFAFAARTGALNSRHAIDNLAINALQLAYGTTANLLDATFGAALPSGWTLVGDAVLDTTSRELVLTPSAVNKNGALVLPALGVASPEAFSAQFDYRAADGSGADGISFNYGVIPASPVGADGGIATSGLVIQMTEFGTDRILIKYDGSTLATGNVTLEGPYRRVSIDVAADRSIAVSVNGAVAVSATLPAGYATVTKTAWQFAFGAKTGASTNRHSVRNLSIARPRGLPAGLALNPVTGVLSGTLTNPAAADYTVTAVATNAIGATLRDVTIANRPLTALSPTFAVATDIGIVRNAFTETGVTLGTITLGFAPRPGQQLTLVQNTGGAASSGRFTGLAEGAAVTAVYNGDTFNFTLSYAGGSGNDVTLTRVLGAGQVAGVATVATWAGSAANAAGSADATGAAAGFSAPFGVAVGTDGTVTVADSGNHKIRQISPAGVVTTLAGSGTSGSADGTGAAASFNLPSGVAVGAAGTVYVADTANHRIRQISPAGVVTTLAGGTSGSADGTGAAAGFSSPYGVAVGTDGTVYVADTANRKIRQISPAGVVTTLAGDGTLGSADGPGAAATFNAPAAIAVGPDGAVYVADYINNKIRRISPAGVVTTLAGDGTLGSADGTGAAARFNAPFGVAVGTDGIVYVADSSNNAIRRITAAGVVTTLAGAGTAGSADGTGAAARFNLPIGVAVGLDGTVYVGDRGNHKVRTITSADARPLLTSSAVTAIAATGATINGTVNPNGFITAAQVEYGSTADLGSTSPITLSPNNGTTAQVFAVTLAGLTTGIPYYYRVKATNVDGTAVTTSGTFTPLAPVKPTLPALTSTNVTATAATWGGTVAADGGATITERGIKYRLAGSTGAYTAVTAAGTTGTFTVSVTGLAGGTTYQFYAYAANSVGEGRTSEERSVTTPALATVPVAATALAATVGGSSAELSFTPGYNGGAAITNYEVSLDNGATWAAMSPATSTPPLTLTGLTPGATYQVKVRAVNSVGIGGASAAVAVTAPVTLAVTSAASASGTFGAAFSYQVTGNGAPTSFAATSLPTGLSIHAGTGAITGTPTQTGTFVAELTIATTTGSAKRALEIVIAKKALTVTADAKSRGYGQDDPAFTATLSGFVGSDTAAVVTGSPKFGVAATTASPVGTYAITPTVGSLTATNYSFGTFVPANLTVTVQPATVSLGGLAQTYNGSTRPVTATTTPAALTVDVTYTGTAGTSYGPSSTAPTDAGSYAIAATINDSRFAGTITGTLVVAKKSQTITIAPLPTAVPLNTLTTVNIAGTASSGLPVTFALASGSAAALGGTAGSYSLSSLNGTTGTVSLVASQTGNGNYLAATPTTADFEVTRSNQTITFTGPADQTYSPSAANTLTLTASSVQAGTTTPTGLAVTFSVVSGPASLSGSTLTLTGPGTVVVRAIQAGDPSTFNPAPSVDQSFNVTRLVQSQTVTFPVLSGVTYGVAPVALGATASSNLPVTYAVISGPATVTTTGGVSSLTITGAGTVTVQASQAGNDDFSAASAVTRTLAVATKTLTVTGATAQAKTYDGSAAAVVSGATLVGVVIGDNVSLAGTTEGTFAQVGAGNGLAVASAMTLVGAQAVNYTLTQPTGLTANINPKSLTVGGVIVADKVYDGLLTASANTGAATFVGLIGSDVVTLNSSSATATFADRTAGSGKTVTIAGLALAGGAAANYTLVQPTATAQILRKTLYVIGATASSRDYDGTTTAVVTYAAATLSGKITGDGVELGSGSATASFDDRRVGTSRPVQIAGLALTGADSGNYNLGQPTLSASITPKAITVTGVTARNKGFDKLTTATVETTGAALVGFLPADSAAVNLVTALVAGEFTTADVGTGKTVSIVGLTLSGAEAANYTLTQPTATATITAAALTVTGIVGVDKPYDGTTAAGVSTALAALAGVAPGSGVTLNVANVTATFATAAVSTLKTVQVAGLALTGPNAANYTLTQPTTTASVSRAVISASGVTVQNKVYDGTTAATVSLTGLQLTGVLPGETVNPVTTGASAAFAEKSVANGKTVSLSGITLDGAHAANYTLSLPTLSANITARPLTVSGIAVTNRAYDGTALVTASFTGASLVGVVLGDNVALDASGAVPAIADGLAGDNKLVTFTGLGLSGTGAANYSLTPPTATVTIARKALTVTGVTASGKIYDGNTAASVDFASAALEGLIPGDAAFLVTSAATAAFASKNAAAGQPVAITGLTLGGAQAANYTLTAPTVAADIMPRPLTMTGITATSRMYNAMGDATINTTAAALVGVLGADVVTLDTASALGEFQDGAVGTAKPVQILNLALTGADAANYSVVAPQPTANITARPLTVIGLTAEDRVYDGTTVATVNTDAMSLVGLIDDDQITLVKTGATAAFATKTVGAAKVVQVSGLTLSGPNAASYTLTQPTTTASITPAYLTVRDVLAADKIYDGNTTATPNLLYAITDGIENGDTVTLDSTAVTASFSSKTAAPGKTVTLAGLALGGADAANYLVRQPTAIANISPKNLTVSGMAASNKVYDRTLAATPLFLGASLVGVVNGDTVSPVTTLATAAFSSNTVATGKTVTISGLTLSGADAANYTVTQPTTTADITAKALTVAGITAVNRIYDATTVAALTTSSAALVGVVGADAVTLVKTSAAGAFASKTIGTAKLVQVSGLTLTSADAGNYTVTQPTTTADITAKNLTVAGVTASGKIYDGNTTALANFATAGLVGIVPGDTVLADSSATTANFSSKTVAAGKTVAIAGLTLVGADAGNYTVTQPTTTADITAKALSVAGITAASRIYDATTVAALTTSSAALVGVVGADAVTLEKTSAAGAFDSKTIGTAKLVQVSGLTLSGADAGNYTVTQPTTTADVTAKALTVSGATVATKIYDNNRTATLSFGSAALVGIISPDSVALLSGAATGTFADANAGRNKVVTITGLTLFGTDSVNYSLTQPIVSGEILSAQATIAISNLKQIYDGQPKTATITVSPAVSIAVVYANLNDGSAPTNAGSYSVSVNVTDPNYSGTANQTLVIAKATQTLTLNAPASATLLTPVAVSATASSNLPVTLAVSGPATLAEGQLTFTAPGTATVTATQAGNENYVPATATATITSLGKLAQTIAFAPLADRLSNSGTFALSATSSSGLPVNFTIISGPALLSGENVTPTGIAGTVVVRASQPGNAVYNAAPDVTVTFGVTSAKTNVYFGTVTNAGSTAKSGDVAAVMPPDSNRGSLLVVAPSVGVNSAFDFTLNADGTFTITYVVPSEALATPSGTPVTAAAPVTLTIRGSLVNGRLQGVIEPLGLAFSAAVLPVTGASANAAGFYQSSNLATAGGSTYSVVGTDNQVLVLATSPDVTTGGLTTLASNGTFNLQTQTSAGLTTVRGSVDAPTTTVSGTISVPGKADTNFAGVATTTTRTDRLINLSSRVRVGSGRTLITGFVLGGTTPKRVLLRAVGPTLSGFGVTGALANPRLQLFDATGKVIAENDDWSGADTIAAMAQVGAFGLTAGAKDAALLVTLAPGAYTMQVAEVAGEGVALAEIYDASLNPNADYQRLVNISTRGEAGIGENVLIGGFIITGNSPKKVLVRGIGPGLAPFGLTGTLADPRLRVYRGSELVGENDNWSAVPADATATAQAARDTGAFALATGSKDAALILTLMPGAYTGQVSSADGTSTGTALVEIYEVP